MAALGEKGIGRCRAIVNVQACGDIEKEEGPESNRAPLVVRSQLNLSSVRKMKIFLWKWAAGMV